MALRNTNTTYGAVAKTFHWLTALLILSAIPLGIIASNLAHGLQDPSATPDEATITLTATLFSLHKTIGITVFFVALGRIAWALGQRKPGLLNGDNAPEAWLAETVHWLLYGSLVAVPLFGLDPPRRDHGVCADLVAFRAIAALRAKGSRPG